MITWTKSISFQTKRTPNKFTFVCITLNPRSPLPCTAFDWLRHNDARLHPFRKRNGGKEKLMQKLGTVKNKSCHKKETNGLPIHGLHLYTPMHTYTTPLSTGAHEH